MIHIVLVEPEIPPNTGNIIRLCANTGAHLHLVHPLSFEFDDKRLRRAGLDYGEYSEISHHSSWNEFKQFSKAFKQPLYALTTKSNHIFFDVNLANGGVFIFGPETRGLSETQLNFISAENRLKIPMQISSRSLNLSNTAAICVYEAWRQANFVKLS